MVVPPGADAAPGLPRARPREVCKDAVSLRSLVPTTDGKGQAQGCLGWVSESSWALWPRRVWALLKRRHRRHSLEQDTGAPFLATVLPEPVGEVSGSAPNLPRSGI